MPQVQPQLLEFPAMLYGTTAAVRREVSTKGQWWAQEYLKTGAFPLPRKVRSVSPGEVLVMNSVAAFDPTPRPRWRVHTFIEVFMGLRQGVEEARQEQKYQRTREAFESFCLSTPW